MTKYEVTLVAQDGTVFYETFEAKDEQALSDMLVQERQNLFVADAEEI